MQCSPVSRRTLTMNWDGLVIGDEDDDDHFFETYERMSSAVQVDLASSGSDDEYEDGRMSFASAISSTSIKSLRPIDSMARPSSVMGGYDMWLSEPGDINERRKRLLQGMGLGSNKNILTAVPSTKIARAVPTEPEPPPPVSTSSPNCSPVEETKRDEPSPETPTTPIVLVRSRSDGDIDTFSAITNQRKEELLGPVSKQRLTRTSSGQLVPSIGVCQIPPGMKMSLKKRSAPSSDLSQNLMPEGAFGSFFLIKNLDTGKEFIVKEYNEQGMWNKLSDVQTGKQLTMEEFEKSVGYSPVVKELMRRENVGRSHGDGRKMNNQNSLLTKSFRNSKRMGAAILKNLTSMSGMKAGDKEQEQSSQTAQKTPPKNTTQWIKARQHGKSYKEFTALHMSQEIQAHEGSIWTMRFSCDAHYLATAGEDRLIHVWEVQECDVMSTRSVDDLSSCGGTPVHPMAATASDRPPLAEITPLPSEKRKKGRNHKKKGSSIPDYVNVPEVVFALSERPVCTFIGHQEDVLDLSWSKSQLLLSSSMDKTVRLWDLETKSCLKMFAHNDYVTCIQFNPVDDDYFISGSLDAKVRVWSVPHRKVVDWTDIHEMVTAACYTPDGLGAVIGSHQGSCHVYNIDVYTRRIMPSPPTDNQDDSPGENQEIIVQNPAQPDSVSPQEIEVQQEVIGASGDHEKVAEKKETGDVATGSEKGKSPENIDSSIAENDDGFRTPTSPGHKIPAPTECPPAPKKAWPPKLKRKASPPQVCRSLQFDEPPDVETIFRALSDDHQDSNNADETTKSKKARRAEED